MPEVPYRPFPSVSPTGGSESIGVQTPLAAFGDNIGAALRQVGSSEEQVGSELFQRAIAMQDLQNETDARQKASNYVEQQGKLQANYDSLSGADARDGLQAHIAASRKLREDIRGTLTNPMAQRMFDADSFNFLERNIFSSARHAGDENRKLNAGEALAAVKLEERTWTDPNDPRERADKLASARRLNQRYGTIQGEGPEQIALRQTQSDNTILASQLIELARKGDPIRAHQLFEDYVGENLLDVKDHDTVEKYIWSRNRAQADRNIISRLDIKGKSVEQLEEQIRQIADDPKLSLGDPDFLKALQAGFQHRTYQEKLIARGEKFENENIITHRINEGAVNNPQEMRNDPQAGPAFQKLDAMGQNVWDKRVYQAVQNRDMQTERTSYLALQAMADQRPLEFLDQNLYDPKWKLSRDDRNHFIARRDALIKKPINDPHVQQGIHFMLSNYTTEMKDLGLVNPDTGIPRKGDQWDQFTGGLSIALQAFEQKNERPPTPDEFREEIAKPLLKTHTEPWWHFWHQEVPEYQRAFTPKERDDARAELSAGGQEPTETEITRHLARVQWERFFRQARPAKPKPGEEIPQ